MDGAAGAEAGGSDATASSNASGVPPSPREELASRLENFADTLRRTHKKLTRTAPKGSQMAFWEQGLEEVQGYLDEVQLLLEECEGLVKAEKKAEASGLGHPEPKAKSDKLSEALKQLDDAIELANQKTSAARASLEMADQDFSAGSRSSDFVKAAGQLKELAWFCEATAVQLEGPTALVRQASAAQAHDSQS